MTTRLAEKDVVGVIMVWYEFICASCSESEPIHAASRGRAIAEARRRGWRKERSPAGLLWVCPKDAGRGGPNASTS